MINWENQLSITLISWIRTPVLQLLIPILYTIQLLTQNKTDCRHWIQCVRVYVYMLYVYMCVISHVSGLKLTRIEISSAHFFYCRSRNYAFLLINTSSLYIYIESISLFSLFFCFEIVEAQRFTQIKKISIHIN